MRKGIFKKVVAAALTAALLAPALSFNAEAGILVPAEEMAVYRIFNPVSGEHFYTASVAELNALVGAGWTYEGIGWYALSDSTVPVYRLYEPGSGEHHYTKSEKEKAALEAAGWKVECVAWYSDPGEGFPIYREHNPALTLGSHNYTMSKKEDEGLAALGWISEGPAWYARSETSAASIYEQESNISYSPYIDCSLSYGTRSEINEYVYDLNPAAIYTAEIKDTSIADAKKDQKGNALIYAKGLGSTTADIYEQTGVIRKQLGTITINVDKQISMAESAESIIGLTSPENPAANLYLSIAMGKTSVDLKDVIKKTLVGNQSLGTTFKEDDYSVSFEESDGDAGSITSDGVVTAKASGYIGTRFRIDCIDNSTAEGFINVKVHGTSIETVPGYNINNIRNYVIGLDTQVELADGSKKTMINFDNAATTPALKAVQDAIDEELLMYGSIGRGYSQKSNHSTDLYNSTRDKVLDFLGADPELYTCFYVNSTTDGLNKLASALIESEDDLVLTTRIEHHANDLSWRDRCNVIYAEVDEKGRVIYDDIERLLKENNVKVVSISAASNVTGYVNDVHRVAKLAHQYGALIVVDGAQIVAHRKFSMLGDTPEENIDFIAFSAHKMYSPYGGGAVVGITEELNKHMPTFYGGGTIEVVGDTWEVYKKAPEVYEAGSPNYPGVVGLGKAIDVLSTVGMDKIEEHEKVLNRRLIDGLKKLDNVIIYGDTENIEDRVGVVTFNFTDINTAFLAEQLSQMGGVATRRGAFCSHPYVWRLMGIDDETAKGFEGCTGPKTAGMVRISFGIYNNEAEVDAFLAMMPQIMDKAREITADGDGIPEY